MYSLWIHEFYEVSSSCWYIRHVQFVDSRILWSFLYSSIYSNVHSVNSRVDNSLVLIYSTCTLYFNVFASLIADIFFRYTLLNPRVLTSLMWSAVYFTLYTVERCGAVVKRRTRDREVPGSIPTNCKCCFLEQETLSTLLSTGFYPGKKRATWKISTKLLNVLPSINNVDLTSFILSSLVVDIFYM